MEGHFLLKCWDISQLKKKNQWSNSQWTDVFGNIANKTGSSQENHWYDSQEKTPLNLKE